MTNQNIINDISDEDYSTSGSWNVVFATSNRDPKATNVQLTFKINYNDGESAKTAFTAPNNDLFYNNFVKNRNAVINAGDPRKVYDFSGSKNNLLVAATSGWRGYRTNIETGSGGDIVFASQKNVSLDLSLGAGNDLGIGGELDDVLRGDDGNDCLAGLGGNDLLIGGAGDDTLYGGAGDDTLKAESGRDFLSGGDGNDRLYGGIDADRLLGGAGNDSLWSGKGNDTLTGNEGADFFCFHAPNYRTGNCTVTITDFSAKDRIDMSSFAQYGPINDARGARIRIVEDAGIALIKVNTNNNPNPELTIRVDGMSFDSFKRNADTYIILPNALALPV